MSEALLNFHATNYPQNDAPQMEITLPRGQMWRRGNMALQEANIPDAPSVLSLRLLQAIAAGELHGLKLRGADIGAIIENIDNAPLSKVSLYPTLDRLVNKGWITKFELPDQCVVSRDGE